MIGHDRLNYIRRLGTKNSTNERHPSCIRRQLRHDMGDVIRAIRPTTYVYYLINLQHINSEYLYYKNYSKY